MSHDPTPRIDDVRRQAAPLATVVAFAGTRGGRLTLLAGTGVAAACFTLAGAGTAHAASDAGGGSGGSASSGSAAGGMTLQEKKEYDQIQRDKASAPAAPAPAAPVQAPAAPAKKAAPAPAPKASATPAPAAATPDKLAPSEQKELAQIQREQASKPAAPAPATKPAVPVPAKPPASPAAATPKPTASSPKPSADAGMNLQEKKELAQIQREQASKAAADKAAAGKAAASAKVAAAAASTPKDKLAPSEQKELAQIQRDQASKAAADKAAAAPALTPQQEKNLEQAERTKNRTPAAQKTATSPATGRTGTAPAAVPVPPKPTGTAPPRGRQDDKTPAAPAKLTEQQEKNLEQAARVADRKAAAEKAAAQKSPVAPSAAPAALKLSTLEKGELAQIQAAPKLTEQQEKNLEQAARAADRKAAAGKAAKPTSGPATPTVPMPAKPAEVVPPGGWPGMTLQERKALEASKRGEGPVAAPAPELTTQQEKQIARELDRDEKYRAAGAERDRRAAADVAAQRAMAQQKPVQMDPSQMTPHERAEYYSIEREKELERKRAAATAAASPVAQLKSMEEAQAEARANEAARGPAIPTPPQPAAQPTLSRRDETINLILPPDKQIRPPQPAYKALAELHEKREAAQIDRDLTELKSAAAREVAEDKAAKDRAARQAKMSPEELVAYRNRQTRVANAQSDAYDGLSEARVSPRQPTGAELQAENDANWKPSGMVDCITWDAAYIFGGGATSCRGSDFTVTQTRFNMGVKASAGYERKAAPQAGSAAFAKVSAGVGPASVGAEGSAQTRTDGSQSATGKISLGKGPLSAEGTTQYTSTGGTTLNSGVTAKPTKGKTKGEEAPKADLVGKGGLTNGALTLAGEAGGGAMAGVEVTSVRRDTREDAVAEDNKLRDFRGGIVTTNSKGQTKTEEYDARRAAERDSLQAGVDKRVASDNERLVNAYEQTHPGQVMPSADRLRVDRWARTQGIDTTSQTYRGGGWQDAAIKAGLTRDQVNDLKREDAILP